MTSSKTPDYTDLTALASEACDLWQEHLAVYAADPKAKAELSALLEPQRQLFAEWAVMMQNGLHGAATSSKTAFTAGTDVSSGTAGTAPSRSASDDSSLRLAQLAHRMAQLENHVAELEKRLGVSGPPQAKKTGKTPRRR